MVAERAELFERLQRSMSLLGRRVGAPRVHAHVVSRAGVEIERAEAQVLAQIAERGTVRLSDLADEMMVSCSTVSRHASRLIEHGLCRRGSDSDDGRVVILEATPDGDAVLRRLRAEHAAVLAETLGDWDSEDLSTATELLLRLQADLATVGLNRAAVSQP